MEPVKKPSPEKKQPEPDSTAGLETIINEIQALQAKSPTEPEVSDPALEQPHSSGDEPWLEETLAHLKEGASKASEEELIADLSHAETPVHSLADRVAHLNPEHSHENENQMGDDSMSINEETMDSDDFNGGILEMTIKGKMLLKLNQGRSEQYITLRFDSDSLQIQLSDGMEFKIPMKSNPLKRAA